MKIIDGKLVQIDSKDISLNGTLRFPEELTELEIILDELIIDEKDKRRIKSLELENLTKCQVLKRGQMVKGYQKASFSEIAPTLAAVGGEKLLEVESWMFCKCEKLGFVWIPKVTHIRSHAFEECDKLEHFSAPSLKRIGLKAFYGCSSLYHTTIPEGVEYISANAFTNSGLNEIELTGNVEVKMHAFQYCINAETVRLRSFEKIDMHAFDLCMNIKEFILSEDYEKSKSYKLPFITGGYLYTYKVSHKDKHMNIICFRRSGMECTSEYVQQIDCNGKSIYMLADGECIVKSVNDYCFVSDSEALKKALYDK